MREPTISAYIQCFSNKTALYKTLASFRTFYHTEPITLISDCGEDFQRFADHFQIHYYRSDKRCDPRGGLGKEGALEYLRRIHEHCQRVSSDYVVILEEDVITNRRVRRFPSTDCGGPRFIPLADPLNRYLQGINRTTIDYGYAMCGGSIFDRQIYLNCYERNNLDLDLLGSLDERIVRYSDVVLTALFLINGYSYGVWDEVSEMHHPEKEYRIVRDSAFDHANKKWYGLWFNESLLDNSRPARALLARVFLELRSWPRRLTP
jgi:hypothetical protein